MAKHKLICKHCGKEYERNYKSKYCSNACYSSDVGKLGYGELKRYKIDHPLEYEIKSIYTSIKSRSKQRNHDFNITMEDISTCMDGYCYYCGVKLDKARFDRLDSNKGYEHGNVVLCCPTCNSMKNASEYEAFINKIQDISKRINAGLVADSLDQVDSIL